MPALGEGVGTVGSQWPGLHRGLGSHRQVPLGPGRKVSISSTAGRGKEQRWPWVKMGAAVLLQPAVALWAFETCGQLFQKKLGTGILMGNLVLRPRPECSQSPLLVRRNVPGGHQFESEF